MEDEENKIHKDVTPTHYLYVGETDIDAVRREFRQLVIEVIKNHRKQLNYIKNEQEDSHVGNKMEFV